MRLGRWGCLARMAAMLWPRAVLRDISPNTCGLTVWVKWSTNLGHLQAELGHGHKRKFEAHITFYKSYLRVIVIRVLHQWLNKLQSGCVSVLSMIMKLQQ
jgi:hypothetical protein